MKLLFSFLVLLNLNSCGQPHNSKIFKTDKDYTEFERIYSPDSNHIILSYARDLGAMGYGGGGTAILQTRDTLKELSQFNVPERLRAYKWIDNKTASAKVDIIPALRNSDLEKMKIQDYKVSDILLKVTAFDYIEANYHLDIEQRILSPNKKYELVAYRYIEFRSSLNFIHVSIIPAGGQIPKYGNYFIADMSSDYALYGGWTEDNKVIFYSNSLYSDGIQYFLVKNRPEIPYIIKVDDTKYSSKYRWMREE